MSHYGVGKSCWDWLILVVSFYVAIVVPYNATFKDKQEDLIGGEQCKIDSIDILVELVFLIGQCAVLEKKDNDHLIIGSRLARASPLTSQPSVSCTCTVSTLPLSRRFAQFSNNVRQ